jgi:hypothetical protein
MECVPAGSFTEERGNINRKIDLRVGFGAPGGFVAGTGDDWQARVLGISRIGGGALAEEELRPFGGFDGTSVEAGSAEASVGRARWLCRVRHEKRIALGTAGGKRGYTPGMQAKSAEPL